MVASHAYQLTAPSAPTAGAQVHRVDLALVSQLPGCPCPPAGADPSRAISGHLSRVHPVLRRCRTAACRLRRRATCGTMRSRAAAEGPDHHHSSGFYMSELLGPKGSCLAMPANTNVLPPLCSRAADGPLFALPLVQWVWRWRLGAAEGLATSCWRRRWARPSTTSPAWPSG